MWALIESNYRPLSYQESVLATELNAQITSRILLYYILL